MPPRGWPGLAERFLVEQMVDGVVLELIVGVQRDARLGLALTLGAGGVLVELVDDTATLLLPGDPRSRSGRRCAVCGSVRCSRASADAPADLESVVSAVEAVAAFATDHADRLVELEVNPLLVLARGRDGGRRPDPLG